jgi:hypothetical protein
VTTFLWFAVVTVCLLAWCVSVIAARGDVQCNCDMCRTNTRA